MRKRLFALGLILAMSIAGAAWARRPATATPVTGRVTSMDEGIVSANGRQLPNAGTHRRSLGLWLLAMTGTAVGLRARRSRTI